ncbi:MAG TPA: amino acid ABC transporter permease [Acidimicrobiales bacterium]|nr:amino acid ABC transporter permease [Acidimicrobiales bacterium]
MTAAARWLRVNLFADRRDSAITLVTAAIVAVLGFRLLRFLFVTGRWEIVRVNLALYLYGRYPRDQLWRIVVAVVLIGFLGGVLAGIVARRRDTAARRAGEPVDDRGIGARIGDLTVRVWPLLALVVVLLALSTTIGPSLVALAVLAAIVLGRVLGAALPRGVHVVFFVLPVLTPLALLPFLTGPLGWDSWGGIMLTLLIASVSMIACFPLGLLLALGRRSAKLPAVRTISVGFIEFFRGVPLVVLVLMSDQALGFFFPQSMLPGKVVRAIVVFTIFTAAYVAEIVRGGLQSVPRGQAEAAQALGMAPWRVTGWIVLPQALRNVIPALVGQFISLFKDTTLVFVIGLLDPLTVADNVTKQSDFELSNFPEALIFAGLLFWVGSYTMSRESQRLERRLGVGTR